MIPRRQTEPEQLDWLIVELGLIHGRARVPIDKIPYLTEIEALLCRDHEIEKQIREAQGGTGEAGVAAGIAEHTERARMTTLERIQLAMEGWD